MSILEGKKVIIAGACGGIGRAVALLFARSGAELIINDRGTEASGHGSDPHKIEELASSLAALGAPVVTDASDVSCVEGTSRLMELARTKLGGLDVLVNCAGILRERAFLNSSAEDLTAVLETHVIGTFRLMQAAASLMRDRGGRIVNTTSQSALWGNAGQSSNAAASAAVIGLTRTAAVELQRYRIYVNTVAPLAKTRQTEALPLFHKAKGLTPEHVAVAYLFLASPLAGETSGEVLTIAGSRLSALGLSERGAEYVDFVGAAAEEPDLECFRSAWERLMT